jgi:glycine hydroxymethyltransferase
MKDKKLTDLLSQELARQRRGIELIPSENYVSADVLEALGSVFTNKYSEGYPGRRYYGGQEFTDQIELIAIERAKKLFRADHANVQPHSGAPANIAVYQAWLKPGDTVMAMSLEDGGHLTHGHPVTGSAKIYNFVRYGIKDPASGEIDYDKMITDARKLKPKIILAGFSGYPRDLDYSKFRLAADAAGSDCMLMADMAHIAGLIAGGVKLNPFDFGFNVITSTTHKTLRGPRGGLILSRGAVGNPLKDPGHSLENIPTLIDRAIFPGMQGGPHMNNILAKAVAFGEALQPDFKIYAQSILDNAQTLSLALQDQGFDLVTGGTSNHLIQIDMMKSFGIDGREAQNLLDSVHLTANCNSIPKDKLPPFKPSGLRLGTPAITTRGMKEEHMALIAKWMANTIKLRVDQKALEEIRTEVEKFCLQFPLPSDKQLK